MVILLRAYPIQHYPAECQQAAAIMLMIMNNLDHDVAQFPEELVTYGGNGQVFSNWAQVNFDTLRVDTQHETRFFGSVLVGYELFIGYA